MASFTLIPSAEVTDLADDVREIFEELASTLNSDQRAYGGECHPALDVFETDTAVEIVGRPGRDLVQKGLHGLVEHFDIDVTIANAENSAAGFGITRDIGDTILEWGVDVMTSGNHIWDKKEALEYIATEPRLLRPANYPAGVPGRGSYVAQTRDGRAVGVINVMGRVFMTPIDDPFAVVLREIEAIRHRTRVIFVDMHAEATSEKIAMGWHLDGKVTAVVGTHTHVQTADERVLPNGTAYMTHAGMAGTHHSILCLG